MLDKLLRKTARIKGKYAESQSPEDIDESTSVGNLALLWISKLVKLIQAAKLCVFFAHIFVN